MKFVTMHGNMNVKKTARLFRGEPGCSHVMPSCSSAQCYGAELGSYQDHTIPKASYLYLHFGYVKKRRLRTSLF